MAPTSRKNDESDIICESWHAFRARLINVTTHGTHFGFTPSTLRIMVLISHYVACITIYHASAMIYKVAWKSAAILKSNLRGVFSAKLPSMACFMNYHVCGALSTSSHQTEVTWKTLCFGIKKILAVCFLVPDQTILTRCAFLLHIKQYLRGALSCSR